MDIEYEDDNVSFIDTYSPSQYVSPIRFHRQNQEPVYAGITSFPSSSSSLSFATSSSCGFLPPARHSSPFQSIVTGFKRKYCSFNSGITDDEDDNYRENCDNRTYMAMDRIDRIEMPTKGSNQVRKITTYGRLYADEDRKQISNRWASTAGIGSGLHFNGNCSDYYENDENDMDLMNENNLKMQQMQSQSLVSGLNKIYELSFKRTSSISHMGMECNGICIFCVTQQHEQQLLPIQARHGCQLCNRLSCRDCIVVCSSCSNQFCEFCVVSPHAVSRPSGIKICHDCNRKSLACSPDGVCKNDIIFF